MATYKQYYGIINGLLSYDYNIVTFDYYGCGDSDKPHHHHDAYNTTNHHEDILAIYNKYHTTKNILIGHSYGTTQIARLLSKIDSNTTSNTTNTTTTNTSTTTTTTSSSNTTNTTSNTTGNIKVILLGTAYQLPNGGHPIFKLPVCILSLLSSYLSSQFVKVAFSSNTSDDIKNISKSISGKNNMTVVKYFYTQFEWATSSDWEALKDIDVLILQGKDDLITTEDNSSELFHFLNSSSSSSNSDNSDNSKSGNSSNSTSDRLVVIIPSIFFFM
jgi:pimeloyl-ACP methyl ester carboxylesterase